MELTKRQINIVYYLLRREHPISIKELAKKNQVSIRTIKYDLRNLREWLAADNDILLSKRNVGIWINEDIIKKNKLLGKLSDETNYDYYLSPQERMLQIISLLALTEQPMKLQQIENKIGVSKSTIVNDLVKIDDYLKNFNLKLYHQQFYGYSLSGLETDIRSCLEVSLHSIFAKFNSKIVLSLFYQKNYKGGIFPELNYELEHILKNLLSNIKNVSLIEMEKENDFDGLLTILIRLTITIARLSINCFVNSYEELTDYDDNSPYVRLCKYCFKEYDFPLIRDEYLYVINGAVTKEENANIVELVDKIVNVVEERTGFSFKEDIQLKDNLVSHLSNKMNSKCKFNNEYNPFVDEIKTEYPCLFDTLLDVCRNTISENPVIVNESFISFIALHFIVSLQKQKSDQKVNVVYVCSTGLGVTNLIQQKISEYVPNLRIAGFASLSNAEEVVRDLKPDFVVSIFHLDNIDAPLLQVNPVPNDEDIKNINEQVNKILGNKPVSQSRIDKAEAFDKKIDKNSKEDVRSFILKAFSIYNEILSEIKEVAFFNSEFSKAFMIHVFMSIYRVEYDEQYQNYETLKFQDTNLKDKIRSIYHKYNLNINESEIEGILEYTQINDNACAVREG